METLYNLILIAVCSVVVIDLSGFIDEAEQILSRRMGIKAHIPKPFSCSLCTTHWIGLIWLICSGRWTMGYYAITLILAFLTPVISDALITLKELMGRIVSLLMRWIQRI